MIKFIDDLVNRDQSELRIDLKRRQTLLKLDAQDHQLLQAFYLLKPKQVQVSYLANVSYLPSMTSTCFSRFKQLEKFGKQFMMNKCSDMK